MRVVFMGTPEFAVPSLELLASEHEVVAVYVRPDAASGRGRTTRPAAAKIAATRLGLPVRQPVSFRDPDAVRELAELDADVVCVAAYGLLLPASVLEAARLGAVNVHASLLPRWRGAAPIQRAILAGDPVVGVSIMRMEEGLDTGPYCIQEGVPADEKNADVLTAELADLGARLLVAALPSIADGTAVWKPQSEAEVTYAAKVTKDDVAPDPALSASENAVRVRASSAAAPARVLLGEKGLTIVEAAVAESALLLAPGAVALDGDAIALGTSAGTLLARRVKPDGKAEMDSAAWARGAHLTPHTTWKKAR